MIVIDASALIELLLLTSKGLAVGGRVFRDGEEWHAPHLVDLEVAQVLGRMRVAGEFSRDDADRTLRTFQDLRIIRHPHDFLLPRIWQLRENFSAYDAAYVALAESVGAPVITCDQRMGRAAGPGVVVEVIGDPP